MLNLVFHLPEWKTADFAVLERCKNKMQDLAGKTGKGSDRFKKACQRLWKLAKDGRGHAMAGEIHSSIDVRALTHLLGKNKDFFQDVPVTEDLLESLYKPRPKLGRLSLLQLITAFFVHFDEIAEREVFNRLCDLICLEIAQNFGQSGEGDFAILNKHRNILFTINGPKNLVTYAKTFGIDLDQALKDLAVDGCQEGRFQRVARFHYYLQTIRELSVGEDHPVLTEICKPQVYNAPAEEGRLMGHEILTLLIDRSLPSDVSDTWRRVIVTIAGDPRVPQASQRYQKWWAFLGEDRIRKVRGWLSRFDLLLFLGILQEYGESTWNSDLMRMFPARKAFLEGLYRQGLISDSRLFVGKHAEKYLNKNYLRHELPEYAFVKDPYRSMIYLRVGEVHLIEGSHSFKLWVFPKLPSQINLMDYSNKEFTPQELSSDIRYAYLKEFNSDWNRIADIIHNPNITWQAKAIEHLRNLGVELDVEELFSKEDYRSYKYRFGL
ncbi:MAG: EH signature domain-containing protein [Syntrophotaleaceae bacterium]